MELYFLQRQTMRKKYSERGGNSKEDILLRETIREKISCKGKQFVCKYYSKKGNRSVFLRIKKNDVQSTLVISTSVFSNNRLSRRENLIPVLT